MIDNEIIAEANALARDFYGLMGYGVPKGYRFHRATHPKERLCWQMAVVAFERLRQTDVERVQVLLLSTGRATNDPPWTRKCTGPAMRLQTTADQTLIRGLVTPSTVVRWGFPMSS
jgi:hypothetical protein